MPLNPEDILKYYQYVEPKVKVAPGRPHKAVQLVPGGQGGIGPNPWDGPQQVNPVQYPWDKLVQYPQPPLAPVEVVRREPPPIPIVQPVRLGVVKAEEEDVKPKIPVQVLDLDKHLGKRRNLVSLVGVELEGAWNKISSGVRIERDGSVFKDKGDAGGLERAEVPGYKCGEIGIGPVLLCQVGKTVQKHYPQLWDQSCGLHVHMSFQTVFYYMLLTDSPAYQDTLAEYLARWAKEEGFPKGHHIWPRFTGESVYCQRKFWPHEQMKVDRKDHDQHREGHRYTMVHYAWKRFKTVECRMLPMMDSPEQAVRAIKQVAEITSAYLHAVDKKRVPVKGKIELPNGDVYEEWIETKL